MHYTSDIEVTVLRHEVHCSTWVSPLLCLAIHPHVQWAAAELELVGGTVKFDMDDSYAAGPTADVFRVAGELARRLRRYCGVELQPAKSMAYNADIGRLRTYLNEHPGLGYSTGRLDDVTEGAPAGAGYGIMVSGIPLGDSRFVHDKLQKKVTRICEGVNKIQIALRCDHDQTLYAMLVLCYLATLTYEMRTLPPDVLKVHLRRADACFVAVAATATTIDFAASDALVQRRLRMPKRHFGGALRSLETTAPAAYAGAFCDVVPSFVPHTTGGERSVSYTHLTLPTNREV